MAREKRTDFELYGIARDDIRVGGRKWVFTIDFEAFDLRTSISGSKLWRVGTYEQASPLDSPSVPADGTTGALKMMLKDS